MATITQTEIIPPPDRDPSGIFVPRRVRRDLSLPSRSLFASRHALTATRTHGDLTEVDEGQFILDLQTMRRLSTIRDHPTLMARHLALVELSQELFGDPAPELIQHELTLEMEAYFNDILRDLAGALSAQGVWDHDIGDYLYTPGIPFLDELREGLTNLLNEMRPRMLQLGRRVPFIPSWGLDHDPNDRLTEFDFEMMAARFRRDVEGLLAYVYQAADIRSLHLEDMEGRGGNNDEGASEGDEAKSWRRETRFMDDSHLAQVRKERRSGHTGPGFTSLFDDADPKPAGEGDESDDGFRSTRWIQARTLARKAANRDLLKGYGSSSRLTKAGRYSETLEPERAAPFDHMASSLTRPRRNEEQDSSTEVSSIRQNSTPVLRRREGTHPRRPSVTNYNGTQLVNGSHRSEHHNTDRHRSPLRSTGEATDARNGIPQFPASGNRGIPRRGGAPSPGGGGPGGGGPPRGGGFPGSGFPGGGGLPWGAGRPPARGPIGPGGGGPPGGGHPGGGGGGHPGGGGGHPGGGGGPVLPAANQGQGPQLLDRYGLPIDDRFRFVPEHFDRKFKPEIVDEWDGNADNLPRWIRSVNRLSRRSAIMHRQLGEIAAGRLTKKAKEWFDSLPLRRQDEATQSWTALRTTIATFYMNRTWLERQKLRANRATFRESGHAYETPTDYFIRKTELLRLVYDLSEAEIIMEVMDGAPAFWRQVIDTQRLDDSLDLQLALKYHENVLIHGFTDTNENEAIKALERRLRTLGITPNLSRQNREPNQGGWRNRPDARTHAVGWSSKLEPPKWPKDDSVRSKGKTPKDKGARPCRHCGSELHWDYECSHSKKGAKQVRAHFANPSDDYLEAQEAYDELYYESDPEEEKLEDTEVDVSSHRVITEIPSYSQDSSAPLRTDIAEPKPTPLTQDDRMDGTHDPAPVLIDHQFKVGRLEKQKLSKAITASSKLARRLTDSSDPSIDGDPLVLRRICSRPPGSTFLGAKATTTKALVGGVKGIVEDVIIDSGSDITLISQQLLAQLNPCPKIRTGQRINLIQVTGAASISGFIEIPLIFGTSKGPVVLTVEAYVVKGMNAPFILGNDFADQYQLSIVRDETGSYLRFGDSGRSVPVKNSVASNDPESQSFHISRRKDAESKLMISRNHRIANKKRRKRALEATEVWIRVAKDTELRPLSVTKVEVLVPEAFRSESIFMEGLVDSFSNEEEAFGSPDCFLPAENPAAQIANFSPRPRLLPAGFCIGRVSRKPQISSTERKHALTKIRGFARLIQTLLESPPASIPAEESKTSGEEGEDLVGPKTAECPANEIIPEDKLLEALDISSALSQEQRSQIAAVVNRNSRAFGLDGRLGNFNLGSFEINLRPGFKEISLPPYPVSPAKREVIDKQLDAWLALKVIEPSSSPWGFPVLVAYWNGKPRLCVDYRKLNELTIPDAFALPRQDDILQALTGSQWLSTFDALAGFNQLDIRKDDWEKTAFRTHRGLFQFRRLPFGLMNGPSVFQRLMQNILSPYLWLFTLVYIDDIVVYSTTFEEHVRHLDLTLQRIADSGITLAPAKCHLGYQSLILLGQKVSRLGMSTHKEKIDAITKLAAPTNVPELQTFLGMMVYFSAYIPYYAWIVTPLFALLKKGTPWKWGDSEEHAFKLAKEVLVSAPVRAFAVPGLGYRLYSDASDVGIACILQQVQPIKIRDLQGTKTYDKLVKAHQNGEPIPALVHPLVAEERDRWVDRKWEEDFEESYVDVERVIAYWSRTLKPAEKNYSPTEREALALKEGLVKFQMFIEGESTVAITDHAALTWTKTFQNVNRRLLSWGTTFAAYPLLRIVHRAGRLHSNVDPISRLKRQTPVQIGPSAEESQLVSLTLEKENDKDIPNFLDRLTDLMSHDTGAREAEDTDKAKSDALDVEILLDAGDKEISVNYTTAKSFNLLIDLDDTEILAFVKGYEEDTHFKVVGDSLKKEGNWSAPSLPQYSRGDDDLLYFEDAEGNRRLCVPKNKITEILADGHDAILDGAHSGYHKTYARIASCYYWPRMSRDIKRYVATCDICQKTKPRRHAPYGYLLPLPIPSRPFEVVTMDFIPELPESGGFNSILVIVDKLTKYGIFIPTVTTITDLGVAKLFFDYVVAHFGLPKQIVMDRDSVWAHSFWKELTKLMGIRRSLSTAHHPQTDGQTEIMNQTLEIALRAYISQELSDWHTKLSPLMLAYNTSLHSSTGFSPAYLLRGFEPLTPARLLHHPDPSINRSFAAPSPDSLSVENEAAYDFSQEFKGLRIQALDSLVRAQKAQVKNYNQGRLNFEFEVGDRVLLNPASLGLTKETRGRGNKLRQKYDGPFEIIGKLSPVTYRLRMPASYKIHPVVNIHHLESYHSTEEFGIDRPSFESRRADFDQLPEYEVQEILGERLQKVRGRRKIRQYRTRFVGYDASFDEWLTKVQLKNAPEALADWERHKGSKRKQEMIG